MTRREPERIYIARRAFTYRQLVDVYRLDELDAEHWIARWERHAEANGPMMGSQGYWDAAWEWMTENHREH